MASANRTNTRSASADSIRSMRASRMRCTAVAPARVVNCSRATNFAGAVSAGLVVSRIAYPMVVACRGDRRCPDFEHARHRRNRRHGLRHRRNELIANAENQLVRQFADQPTDRAIDFANDDARVAQRAFLHGAVWQSHAHDDAAAHPAAGELPSVEDSGRQLQLQSPSDEQPLLHRQPATESRALGSGTAFSTGA